MICLVQYSCTTSTEQVQSEEQEQSTMEVESDDQEMNAAIQKSRKTFDEFLTAFQSKDSSIQNFAIKVPFQTEKDGNEHIWLSDITMENGKIYGAVNNEPESTKEVVFGEKVKINRDSISDWNYIQNNRLVGGYTIKLLRQRMTPEQRVLFDRSTGLKME